MERNVLAPFYDFAVLVVWHNKRRQTKFVNWSVFYINIAELSKTNSQEFLLHVTQMTDDPKAKTRKKSSVALTLVSLNHTRPTSDLDYISRIAVTILIS